MSECLYFKWWISTFHPYLALWETALHKYTYDYNFGIPLNLGVQWIAARLFYEAEQRRKSNYIRHHQVQLQYPTSTPKQDQLNNCFKDHPDKDKYPPYSIPQPDHLHIAFQETVDRLNTNPRGQKECIWTAYIRELVPDLPLFPKEGIPESLKDSVSSELKEKYKDLNDDAAN